MQTEQYFLCEIVLPFCLNVLHRGYWHAAHSLQTIIYFWVNPVIDSERDMRYSDQDLVNPSPRLAQHFPLCHHPVPDRGDCQVFRR